MLLSLPLRRPAPGIYCYRYLPSLPTAIATCCRYLLHMPASAVPCVYAATVPTAVTSHLPPQPKLLLSIAPPCYMYPLPPLPR